MASVIARNGTLNVTVPDGQKIAIFSNAAVVLSQVVGYPQFPESLKLIKQTAAGETYTSAAVTGATEFQIQAGPLECWYEVGATPVIAEPQTDIVAADATFDIVGLTAAQGGYVKVTGGTSTTAGNAGGAVNLVGGTPGATGVGGAVTLTGGAGGSTSGTGGAVTITSGAGTAGNANSGNLILDAGAPHGSGLAGQVIVRDLLATQQGAPTAKTTAATLTIAELKTGILTGTHTAGATQEYTLPTGTLTDAALQFAAGDSFDWVLINLSAAAADTITIGAGVGHTIVGNAVVSSSHATTIDGASAQFRTRKTAANTYVTYRIA
jgi:hypothetical protein